jgi:hypothetical protein
MLVCNQLITLMKRTVLLFINFLNILVFIFWVYHCTIWHTQQLMYFSLLNNWRWTKENEPGLSHVHILLYLVIVHVLDYILCLDFFLIIADCIFSSNELISLIKICTPYYFCILAWQPDIFIFHLLQKHGFFCSDYTDWRKRLRIFQIV